MPDFRYDGQSVEVSSEGFLLDSSRWTPELAEALARDSGVIPLTERHWKVLSFCREDAARQGQPPGLRRIAKLSGVEMKELYRRRPAPLHLSAEPSAAREPVGSLSCHESRPAARRAGLVFSAPRT